MRTMRMLTMSLQRTRLLSKKWRNATSITKIKIFSSKYQLCWVQKPCRNIHSLNKVVLCIFIECSYYYLRFNLMIFFSYVYVVGETSCYNVTSVFCGQCLKTTVFSSPATSPIMKEHQSWQSSPINFPTWTESVWKTIDAKMFLRGNKSFEHGIFSLGLITSIVSFILVYIINKNAKIVFADVKNVELDNPVPVEMWIL